MQFLGLREWVLGLITFRVHGAKGFKFLTVRSVIINQTLRHQRLPPQYERFRVSGSGFIADIPYLKPNRKSVRRPRGLAIACRHTCSFICQCLSREQSYQDGLLDSIISHWDPNKGRLG